MVIAVLALFLGAIWGTLLVGVLVTQRVLLQILNKMDQSEK